MNIGPTEIAIVGFFMTVTAAATWVLAALFYAGQAREAANHAWREAERLYRERSLES